MTTAPGTETVLSALMSAITEVSGLDAQEIREDMVFGQLEVDSLGAIEIVVLVADELDLRVDLQDLNGDWLHLTVGDLAGSLARALHRKTRDVPEQGLPQVVIQHGTEPAEALHRDTANAIT